MAKPNTETLLVDVREQSVALYVPAAFARRLGKEYGVQVERRKPFETGVTLEVRKNTLTLRAFDWMAPGKYSFSALHPSPPGIKVANVLVWGVRLDSARCHHQPVDFKTYPGRMVGTLPPDAKRTWYNDPTDDRSELYHPYRGIALRELRLRGPMKLIDVPGWAQNVLTPEERLAISRGEYWRN